MNGLEPIFIRSTAERITFLPHPECEWEDLNLRSQLYQSCAVPDYKSGAKPSYATLATNLGRFELPTTCLKGRRVDLATLQVHTDLKGFEPLTSGLRVQHAT